MNNYLGYVKNTNQTLFGETVMDIFDQACDLGIRPSTLELYKLTPWTIYDNKNHGGTNYEPQRTDEVEKTGKRRGRPPKNQTLLLEQSPLPNIPVEEFDPTKYNYAGTVDYANSTPDDNIEND